MVNEITVSLFIFSVIVQIGFMTIAFLTQKGNSVYAILFSMVSVIFGFTNSNMILNKNVVEITETGTTVVIQSLPLHYLLQGLSVFMGIVTLYFILLAVNEKIQKDKTMTKSLFGDWKNG